MKLVNARRPAPPGGVAAEIVALTNAGLAVPEIAAAVGVVPLTVRRWQVKAGLRARRGRARPHRWTPGQLAAVAAAPSGAAAALALGVGRSAVYLARRNRLGVPAATPAESGSAGRRAFVAARVELAGRYGFDGYLHPTALSVLLFLLRGPSTRADIFAAVGPDKRYVRLGNSPVIVFLRRLVRRGLVAFAHRGGYVGRGGCARDYFLTPLALDTLAAGTGVTP